MDLRAIQNRLNELGFGPLTVDGKTGPATTNAIKLFQCKNNLKVDGIAGPKTLALLFPSMPVPKGTLMSTSEIMSKYGAPGDKNLVKITLPFPLRISWDLQYSIDSFMCHKLVAEKMVKVFEDLLAHYGLAEIQRLGIDLYGGCYAYRKMRNGTDWSRHAWGIAIDLDPARNPLKATSKTAQFAKPEYKAMIDIFYKNGFVGLGREKNYDWMHFQIGQ